MVTPVVIATLAQPRTRQLVLVELAGAVIGAALGVLVPAPRAALRAAATVAVSWIVSLAAVVWFLSLVLPAHGALPEITGALVGAGFCYAAGIAALLFALGAFDAGVPPFAPAAAVLIVALGFLPTADVLTGFTATPWLGGAARYWLVAGPLTLGVAFAIAALLERSRRNATELALAVLMRPAPGLFVVVAGLCAATLSLLLAYYAFHFAPWSSDEYAQLWHAKMIAAGRLALPREANPEFFSIDNVIDQGKWFSQFPIGGPILLGLGYLVRAPMIIGPVLLGLSAVNVYLFTRKAYGEMLARAATLLFVLSPFALFVSGSYMNHVPTLWLATTALAALPGWSDDESRGSVAACGARIGAAVAAMLAFRPLDALLVAVVIGSFQVHRIVREERSRRRLHLQSLAAQFAAGIPFLILIGWVNWRLAGSPFRYGYEVMYGANHLPGFRIDPYGNPFTPIRAVQYAATYLVSLQMTLFEWPLPALLLVVTTLFLLRRTTPELRWDALLVALLLAQVAAYSAYWHLGQFRGPRFLFTAVPALVILAARAPSLLVERTRGLSARAIAVLVPVCVVAAWSPLPGEAGVWARVAEYRYTPREFRPSAMDVVRRGVVPPALVFVDDGLRHMVTRMLVGVGIPASTAAVLAETGDVCSELAALQQEQAAPRPATVVQRFTAAAGQPLADPAARMACLHFMVDHAPTHLEFGDFLLQEQIGADGRLDGPIVFAADLGPHNEALRARFAGRHWYRLIAPREPVAIDSVRSELIMHPDTTHFATPMLVPYTTEAYAVAGTGRPAVRP